MIKRFLRLRQAAGENASPPLPHCDIENAAWLARAAPSASGGAVATRVRFEA